MWTKWTKRLSSRIRSYSGFQSIEKVFAVFEAVIIAAFSGSRLFTFVGDYGRAVYSFRAIQVSTRSREIVSRAKDDPHAGLAETQAKVFQLLFALIRGSHRA